MSLVDSRGIEPAPVADVRQMLRRHAVSVNEIHEFAHGIASRNFYACGRDGRAFAIRYDRRRSLNMVRVDRVFSEQARRSGLDGPLGPWMDCDIDGASIVARPYLNGRALPDIATERWPSGGRFGRMLGALHAVDPPASRRPFFYRTAFDLAPDVVAGREPWSGFMADAAVEAAMVRDAANRIRAIPSCRHRLRMSPDGFVHGDYTPGNFLLSEARLFLIDWEKACIGPRYSDLAQALYYFCAAVPTMASSFASEFIAGYASRHPIDAGSLRAWFTIHPAVIFLTDTANALENRRQTGVGFSERREAYFTQQTLPRYKAFLEMEQTILALM